MHVSSGNSRQTTKKANEPNASMSCAMQPSVPEFLASNLPLLQAIQNIRITPKIPQAAAFAINIIKVYILTSNSVENVQF